MSSEPVAAFEATAETLHTPLIVARLDLPRTTVAEDAPSLVAGDPVLLLGVFDGLGGAGSRTVPGEDGERSSAYYASRTAAKATADTAARGLLDPRQAADAAATLSRAIDAALAVRNAAAPVLSGAVRSTLIRSYPTTAAVLLFAAGSDTVDVAAIWAGDSRCYVLTPTRGLQQLSRDDSRSGADPMKALREDGPMSNMLDADSPSLLHARSYRIGLPAILLVVSDGGYGCLPSPMHFELVLLQAIEAAQDDVDWSAALEGALLPRANDDISLAAAFLGWSSLAEVGAAFGPRLATLRDSLASHDRAMAEAREHADRARQLHAEAEAALAASWDWYRPDNMALMGDGS